MLECKTLIELRDRLCEFASENISLILKGKQLEFAEVDNKELNKVSFAMP